MSFSSLLGRKKIFFVVTFVQSPAIVLGPLTTRKPLLGVDYIYSSNTPESVDNQTYTINFLKMLQLASLEQFERHGCAAALPFLV
jgi:hypothetical protein